MLMEGYQLRQAEQLNQTALAAWWGQQVKATTGSGKQTRPYYKKISDLFDYDELVDKIKSSYDPDYTPSSHKAAQRTQAQIVADRMEEYARIRAKQKQAGKGG